MFVCACDKPRVNAPLRLWVPVLCQRRVSMERPGESNEKKKESEQPAALPVTEHAYGHPSSCPRLCHASQEDADWFTLDPALSPLLRRLSSLPALLHLSTICSILLSLFSHMYSLISLFLQSLFIYMVTHVWATWFYFWVGWGGGVGGSGGTLESKVGLKKQILYGTISPLGGSLPQLHQHRYEYFHWPGICPE